MFPDGYSRNVRNVEYARLETPSGINLEHRGFGVESHRNPLQRVVLHKGVPFLKHYFLVTKSVKHHLSHLSAIPV